ncbi:hypothetical protein E1161_00440 [Saccharopolyspora aridisoli]|uniref:Low molecular weight antigen MTB12-like C-terminal domain-containing protein n=1 Tax=Saccharopolyspora aridisoli TaxID=2530385 RepID=A0A4R4UVZ3_9PSEU|nr:DUF4878 domain-containing protein [Saccharopolyspora aridisoli]TDC96738.1 hypothetical protein E1161_00440 [Saccharopolyspora aridisoli]
MTSSPNEPGQSGSEKQPAEETETSAVEQPSESSAAGHGDAESGAEKSGAEQPGAEQGETDAEQTEKSQPAAETSESSEAAEPSEAAKSGETPESSSESGETSGSSESGEASASSGSESGEEPAKEKSKVGMIVAVAASVLVIAVVAVGAFWLFSGGSAQSTAEDYAALSTKETQDPRSVKADDYRAVVCNSAMPQIEELQKQKEEFLKVAKPQDLEMLKQVKTTVKAVQENGDTGTATMESTVPGQQPQAAELKLVKEDGDWKLCA